MTITMDINYNRKHENNEALHNSFLIMMKNTKELLISASCFYGQGDWLTSLEFFFNSQDKEILEACGYVKNKNSFDRMQSYLELMQNKVLLKIMMETECKDIPNEPILAFLKVER